MLSFIELMRAIKVMYEDFIVKYDEWMGIDSVGMDGKVDKVTGKGLSENDYTTAEKNKLETIEDSANNYTHPLTHPVAIIDGHLYPLQFVKTDVNGNAGWGYVTWGEIVGKPSDQDNVEFTTRKGAANGYCPLGSDGKIDPSFIGSMNISDVWEAADEASMLALSSAGKSDFAIRNDLNNAVYMLKALPSSTLANWVPMNFNAHVASVNGKTGVVILTKADIGLGNVDNTSDTDKPISVAVAEALADKQPLNGMLSSIANLPITPGEMLYITALGVYGHTTLSNFARMLLDDTDAAAMRATLGAASPADISTAISALVASSPAALDTLNELAAALGNDANFATTMMNALAGKQPFDATLTAIAGLVSATDKMIYSTGADTFAMTTLTSFARSLLDDVNAADMRATIGAVGSFVANDPNAKTALNAGGAAPIYAGRAWVYFNAVGTVTILGSGNVSSITDNAVGDFTENFITAMPDANYCPVDGMGRTDTVQTAMQVRSMSTTSFQFHIRAGSNNVQVDNPMNFISVFR